MRDRFLLSPAAMLPALRVVLGDAQWVVSTHALLIVVAVLAGTMHAVRRAREPLVVLACAPCVAAAGIAGSRAAFALLRGGDGTPWSGGLTSMGGIAGGLGVVLVAARMARVPAAGLLDAFVPAGLLALGVGRIGCFLGGCCYGAITTLPWGVVFPDVPGGPRHPLQLYSALFDVALVVWLGRVRGGPGRYAPGRVARLGCVGFGLGRAVLETLRDPGTRDLAGGVLTVAQVGGLALAAVALLVPVRAAWSGRRDSISPASSPDRCDTVSH